jgi:hypothetical protein
MNPNKQLTLDVLGPGFIIFVEVDSLDHSINK